MKTFFNTIPFRLLSRHGWRCLGNPPKVDCLALGGVFTKRKILCIIAATLLLLCTCSSGSETSTISISFGLDNTKATVPINDIRHVIVLDGPTSKQTMAISGSGTARASVTPGTWRIEVEGYYGNNLYSIGSATADVKAGRNTNVTVYMTVIWGGASIGGGAALGGIGPTIHFTAGDWPTLRDIIENIITDSAHGGGLGNLNFLPNQNIQITAPLVADTSITVPSRYEVTLLTSGASITRGPFFSGNFFTVAGTLNLGMNGMNTPLSMNGSFSGTTNELIDIGSTGRLNMYNGVILENNVNSGNGGAVTGTTNSDFYMYGGTITGNSALQYGGGVYMNGAGTFYMGGNATIDSNYTTETTGNSNGGGVYFIGTLMKMEGSSKITHNEIHGNGIPLSMGGASRAAGAIGGGVCVYGNLEISGNAEISNNVAEAGTGTGQGGGVNWDDTFGGTSLSISGNVQISYNRAESVSLACFGGGIFAASSGTNTIEIDLSDLGGIHHNNAIATDPTNGNSLGGGIRLQGSGTFTIKGSTKIHDNTADGASQGLGGGVSAAYSLSIEGNTQIYGNTAKGPTAEGGGIHFSGSTYSSLMDNNSRIYSNTAEGSAAAHGGGVYVDGSVTFTMNNGFISDNRTIAPAPASLGGGLYVVGTFIKSGPGVVDGSSGAIPGLNASYDNSPIPVMIPITPPSPGHAVYIVTPRRLNGSASDGYTLVSTSATGNNGGAWDP